MSSKKTIKSAFESMLFTWGEPLEAKAAADVFNITRQEAIEYFTELQQEYEQEGRGIVIRRINQSFQFVTREENADYVKKLCTPVKTKRLSQSALEVLAIIAYKQPVTKGEIEAIRGIRCDRVVDGLLKKELICEKGRSDSVGHDRYIFTELRLFFHQRPAPDRRYRKHSVRRLRRRCRSCRRQDRRRADNDRNLRLWNITSFLQ